MKLVTIAGPLHEFDLVARSCVIDREFHPENAINVLKSVKGLLPFDPFNPYAPLLRRAREIADRAGIPLDYAPFPEEGFSPEDCAGSLDDMENLVNPLLQERVTLSERLDENNMLLMQLENVLAVDVPLQDFFSFSYVKFRFGRMPREVYNSFHPHIAEREYVFFFKTNADRNYVYGMYMAPRSRSEEADSLFASLQFERVRLSARLHGTGEQAMDAIRADTKATERRVEEVARELATLRREKSAFFLSRYSYIRYISDSYDARRYAAHTEESFYMLGWVPDSAFDAFAENVGKYKQYNVVLLGEDPEGLTDFVPPVQLKNRALLRPFEPLVAMYGLPAYNETDPTPFIAVVYSFLFGIMYGDVGHGILLALTGCFMWKAKRMWLGRVLIYTGAASVLFGLLYGSVFGSEELLPFGFDLLSESHLVLTFSIYGGAALLCAAIAVNIVNGIRQRDTIKTLFGPNALAGLLMYSAMALTVLPFLGFGTELLSASVTIPVIFCAAAVVFCREPLSKFCEGRRNWKPHEGVGGFLVTNFFEMFEILLSFLSNTLSFLRVGAFAISHAAMMTVVYALAETASGSHNIVVLAFGNIFVAAIEGLLVGIQVLRLNFYELFGRFYGGSGRPYEPIKIDYRSRKD
jgi:V/A-type H+-transporting ATPase subunit I